MNTQLHIWIFEFLLIWLYWIIVYFYWKTREWGNLKVYTCFRNTNAIDFEWWKNKIRILKRNESFMCWNYFTVLSFLVVCLSLQLTHKNTWCCRGRVRERHSSTLLTLVFTAHWIQWRKNVSVILIMNAYTKCWPRDSANCMELWV